MRNISGRYTIKLAPQHFLPVSEPGSDRVFEELQTAVEKSELRVSPGEFPQVHRGNQRLCKNMILTSPTGQSGKAEVHL